jgi:hypothetical protein
MKKISSYVITLGIGICIFSTLWFGPSAERTVALAVFSLAGVLSFFYL